MNKKAESLRETFIKALENYKKKNYKNAEIYCYKILNIDPHHFDSISLLATISAVERNFVKAKDFLQQAIKIKSDNTSVIHNLATAYKELGDSKEAIKYYKKVLDINTNHVNANYNLGLVYYNLKELKLAKYHLKKTTDLQNNFAFAYFSLANIHVELKEYNDAISCYKKTVEINPKIVGAHNNLGLVFREINDFKNAISSYEKAIEIKKDHAASYHNLALAYKELGNFEKAASCHKMAIKYEPENFSHYYFLSELKKDILNLDLKEKIQKTLTNEKMGNSNKAFANYILAKYEKKNKNYEKEISFLVNGHKFYFESMIKKFKLGIKYCFDDVIKISEGVKVENPGKKNYNEIKPIFIVGVPRSGSTLVEKIISSGKTTVFMGEESAVFENYINKKILEKKSLNLGPVEHIRNEINDIYKQKGILSKKNNYIFTDKSLNNFFYIELIKDIYPEAKIINCKRDFLSSIMSIFQNNLTELSWTHDLDNVFKYFDNYLKIIENYDEVYPDVLYHLEFEKLIGDPENESKKLMKFCNLEWSKECLEFYKRKDVISKTASNVQIRKSIYKHSSDRYLPYKKFINKYGTKYSWFN